MALDDRVRRLERASEPARTRMSPREWWQHRVDMDRVERSHNMPKDVYHCRDLIGLYRVQDKLAGMTADELIGRILAWSPPTSGLTRDVAEREVARAIYNGAPGTEDMVCPPRWRDCFVAADELREHARGLIERGVQPEEWPDIPDLTTRAIGPDWEDITQAEAERRIEEIMVPVWEDPRYWRYWLFGRATEGR